MASDVVLFGELHDDPIMHWLQAELIRNMLAEASIQRSGGNARGR